MTDWLDRLTYLKTELVSGELVSAAFSITEHFYRHR